MHNVNINGVGYVNESMSLDTITLANARIYSSLKRISLAKRNPRMSLLIFGNVWKMKMRVVALCAVETVQPNMQETMDAAALKTEARSGAFGPCEVEGPISLDLATDAQSAQVKGYESPVAGDADILLCPSIVAGNLLGKALYGLAGGQMAGVVLGATVPITINSRGATPEEKYSSILICSAMGNTPE